MSRTLKEAIKEELLTCTICMDFFQDPKILPCLHTFCDDCLKPIFQHEINTTGRHQLTCPTCRASIQGETYEDLDLKSDFHTRNLLETIQSSPNNESFVELYRVKEGLNLDLAQVVAIAEKSQSRYLLTGNHELATTITDLRRQLAEQQLEHQRAMEEVTERQKKLEEDLKKAEAGSPTSRTAELEDLIAQKYEVIDDMHNANVELWAKYTELKKTKEDLEKIVEKYRKVPFLYWFINDVTDANSGRDVERTKTNDSWFSRWFSSWFTRKRDM